MSKERAKGLAASNDLKELEESLRLFRVHLQEFPADVDARSAMKATADRFALFLLANQQRELVGDCLCRLSLPDQELLPALVRLREAVAGGKEPEVRGAVSHLKDHFEASLRRAWGVGSQANLVEAAQQNLTGHPDLLCRLNFPAPVADTWFQLDVVEALLSKVNDLTFEVHKDKLNCAARNYIALWSLLTDDQPPYDQPPIRWAAPPNPTTMLRVLASAADPNFPFAEGVSAGSYRAKIYPRQGTESGVGRVGRMLETMNRG